MNAHIVLMLIGAALMLASVYPQDGRGLLFIAGSLCVAVGYLRAE